MEVQRVRVVDSWAVKCGNGKYLDAHAVNVVNTIIIGLFVLLSFSWAGVGALEGRGAASMSYELLPNDVTRSAILAVITLLIALVQLVPVSQIIRHGNHTLEVLAVTIVLSVVAAIVIALQSQFVSTQTLVGTVPVYVIMGGLAAITADYYR